MAGHAGPQTPSSLLAYSSMHPTIAQIFRIFLGTNLCCRAVFSTFAFAVLASWVACGDDDSALPNNAGSSGKAGTNGSGGSSVTAGSGGRDCSQQWHALLYRPSLWP
jgi:hypothetical protein